MNERAAERVADTVKVVGLGVSPGIAQGPAYLLDRSQPKIHKYSLQSHNVDAEVERFERAIEESRLQLQDIRERLARDFGTEHLYIIDSHILLLQDELLITNTIATIRQMEINAEWALKRSIEHFQTIFSSFDDDYLRARRADLQYLGNRVLRNLMGQGIERMAADGEPVVIIAHDLSPDDTIQLTRERVLGFATEVGGHTSHTAIMARSLEIPAVVGVHDLLRTVHTGDFLIIDGQDGTLLVNPTAEQQAEYQAKRQQYLLHEEELLTLTELPSVTLDGHRLRLDGNIETPEEIASLRVHGAEGIGLYRTEYLCMNRNGFPSEEEQYLVYQEVARRIAPNKVVFRTFDLGGDKFLSLPPEHPAIRGSMGLRAIRLCLRNQAMFKSQLRAVLRASSKENVRLLYPLITSVDEVLASQALLEEARAELRQEGQSFDEHLEVGLMIETPAAAGIADLLAKEVDFFSIGTNDLIQYAMAIDRTNDEVAGYYDPLHPYVLRCIQDVVRKAQEGGIWVGVCGEMAADAESIPLLIGMGVHELSVNPVAIPHVKQIIRALSRKHCEELTQQALSLGSATAVRHLVKETLASLFDCGE
ncbi:MAG: phosphoenolpyruvate--protein phosphotransferase [Candidatus Tectomicrobia bacterium]|nr:phosphoenolpyruvate--protein phosphotransferase [Candidatus Tectomicrobia bacterium]